MEHPLGLRPRQPRRIILEAAPETGVRRFLSELHVTLEDGKRTSWVTVTRTGSFTDPRYGQFDITRQMLLQMVTNFEQNAYGQEVFVDVAHKPSDGSAAKILKLTVEGDRLRALVEWTALGVDAVQKRGFRYLSAEFHENFTDNETGQSHGCVLLGAGLVIRPCIKRLDPVQLSEADTGDTPVLLHPTLQANLLEEIRMKFAAFIKALGEKLKTLKLSEATIASILAAYTKSLEAVTDEAVAKTLGEQFETTAKTLAEQIGDKPAVIQLSMAAPAAPDIAGEVKKFLEAQEAGARQLQEKLDGNKKLLAETIGAAASIPEDLRKQLGDEAAALVTPEMSADQVKRLAETQIANGNRIAAAQKLSGMGFRPAGSVHISVDDSNAIKALQETADRRLGIAGMSDDRRYARTGGKLQAENKTLAEKVLAAFDAERGHQLHAEHKLLAAGDGKVSDVAVPATFERTVIREYIYNLVGLQFVDSGTAAFSPSTMIPYSYRDTTAAGRSDVRIYEGQSIKRAGVKQASDTAYPIPQKIAFEVSDELRYLTANGQFINWDVVAENALNAIRIIGEDTEKLIFDEQANAADQYASTAVINEAVATANGTKTIFPLASFPVLRPKKIYDLQGNQVGNTLYGIGVTVAGSAVTEWDGTGTQTAGTYWWIDYNLGELHFVDKDGAPSAPANTSAIVASYTYTTNVYKFDTDLGSITTPEKWDDFLYRFGLRKSLLEDQRSHLCNFGLMSGTVYTQIEQARAFVESWARTGTSLTAEGNLGQIKNVPQYKAFAPGLAMGDQRVVIGERGLTRFRMAKPWALGQLQDQKDSNGRFTGKKEAYGDQYIFLHTPSPLKAGLTTVALYSATARVSR